MHAVSILMPVYNASRYVDAAVGSLLSQTFDDFVIIAIDDCSTDDSFEKLVRLAGSRRANGRMKVFRNKKNCGVTATLNFGLEMADSPYLARMDADDIAEANRLAVQVDVLKSSPDIGLVASTVRQFRDGADDIIFPASPIPDHLIPLALTFENPIVHPTILARASLFKEHRLCYSPDKEHVEDYDLISRISLLTRIRILPEPLLRYRVHPHQVSAKFNVEQSRAMRAISLQQAKGLGLRPTALEFRLNACLGGATFPVPGFRFLLDRWTKKLGNEYARLAGAAQADVAFFIEERQRLALQRHRSTLSKLKLSSKLYWQSKSLLEATRGLEKW